MTTSTNPIPQPVWVILMPDRWCPIHVEESEQGAWVEFYGDEVGWEPEPKPGAMEAWIETMKAKGYRAVRYWPDTHTTNAVEAMREAAASLVEGGRFLTEDSLEAKWAKVVAARIRELTVEPR